MANFPSFTFTAAGRAAITRSLSGKDVDRLIITKCVLGDGVYSGSIETLKAVTSPKMTVTVSEHTDNGDGTSVTRFVYDNASLDVGFSHREMGIYAKNGDSGTELLLCYSNAGNQYSYMKAGTVDSVTKQRKATMPPQTFKFVLATGGSGSVDAVIDPKGYVDVEMLEEHNADATAHPEKLVNLTTNGNSLRAVKGDGTNVDVVVPYAVGTTQANPKNLGNYSTNKISDIRDLFNKELADMNTKGCSVRFIKLGANLSTIYENWGKNWDATMSSWGAIYGVMSLLGDDTYANVELVGLTGATVLLQRIAGNWKPAETKVYTNGMLNVADTLKLQSNELTLDMGNGTQTNISIGLTPKNYSGSGFTYTFYNGKNSLADLAAKTISARVIGSYIYSPPVDLSGKTIANFRSTIRSAMASTSYLGGKTIVVFTGDFPGILAHWADTTFSIASGPTFSVEISNINSDSNYAHCKAYSYFNGEYHFYVSAGTWSTIDSNVLTSSLAPYAPLSSPVFTGTPTAPTADGSNAKAVANVEYVLGKSRASYGETGFRVSRDGCVDIWGSGSITSKTLTITLPIPLDGLKLAYAGINDIGAGAFSLGIDKLSNTQIIVYNNSGYSVVFRWIIKAYPA